MKLPNFMKNNILFKSVAGIYSVLTPSQRKQAMGSVFLILFNSVLDIFTIASVLPLIIVILDSSIIQTNSILRTVYLAFGFHSDRQFLAVAALVMLCLFIVKNVLGFLIQYRNFRFGYHVAASLSGKQLQEFFNQDYLGYVEGSASRSLRDIQHVPTEFAAYVLLTAVNFLSDALIFGLILAGMAVYNFQIFLLLAGILSPLLLIFYQLKKHKLLSIGQRSKRLIPQSVKQLLHAIHGYVEIKFYDKEAFFKNKFWTLQQEVNQNVALLHSIQNMPIRFIEVSAVLGLVIILFYLLLSSYSSKEAVVLISLFVAAAYRIMPSLNRLFISVINMKTYHYTLELLPAGEGEQSETGRQSVDAPSLHFEEGIELRNISFSYPNGSRFAIRGINMTIQKGETVGLYGRTGAGKTTLMNILLRFLSETSGQMLVDGQRLTAEKTASWRRLIGYVKQDPFLLDGSLIENIAFGESPAEIDERRLREAIHLAGLSKLASQSSNGMKICIGEHGAKLSGGQRQRVAIARALYCRAEILIFDEATSELDQQTEREIVDAIRNLSGQNLTLFIIAHRQSTLQHCDRIFKLQEGELAGIFTLAQLSTTGVDASRPA